MEVTRICYNSLHYRLLEWGTDKILVIESRLKHSSNAGINNSRPPIPILTNSNKL